MHSHPRPRGFFSEIQCRSLSPYCDSRSERCLVTGLRRALGRLYGNPLYNFAYSKPEASNDYFYEILHTLTGVDFEFQKLENIFSSFRLQCRHPNTNAHGECEVVANLDFAVQYLLSTVHSIKQELINSLHVGSRKHGLRDWEHNSANECPTNPTNVLEKKLDTLIEKLDILKFKIGEYKDQSGDSKGAINNSHVTKFNCNSFRNRRNSSQRLPNCGNGCSYKGDMISDSNNIKLYTGNNGPSQPQQSKLYVRDPYGNSLRNSHYRVSRSCRHQNIQTENATFNPDRKNKKNTIAFQNEHMIGPNHRLSSGFDDIRGRKQIQLGINTYIKGSNNEDHQIRNKRENYNASIYNQGYSQPNLFLDVKSKDHGHASMSNPHLSFNNSKHKDIPAPAMLGTNNQKRKEAGWSVNRSRVNLAPRKKNKLKGWIKNSNRAKRNRSGFSINSNPTLAKRVVRFKKGGGKKNSKKREQTRSPHRVYVTGSTPFMYRTRRKRKPKRVFREVVDSPSMFSIHLSRPRNTRIRKTRKQKVSPREVVGSPSIFSIHLSRPRNTRIRKTHKQKVSPREVVGSPSIFSINLSRPRNTRIRKSHKQKVSPREVVVSPSKLSVHSSKPRNTRGHRVRHYKVARKYRPTNECHEEYRRERYSVNPNNKIRQCGIVYKYDPCSSGDPHSDEVVAPTICYPASQQNDACPYQQPSYNINDPDNCQYNPYQFFEPYYERPTRREPRRVIYYPPTDNCELAECLSRSTTETTESSSSSDSTEKENIQRTSSKYVLVRMESSSSSSETRSSRSSSSCHYCPVDSRKMYRRDSRASNREVTRSISKPFIQIKPSPGMKNNRKKNLVKIKNIFYRPRGKSLTYIGRFLKERSRRDKVIEYDEEYDEYWPVEETEEPKQVTSTYSRRTSTEAVPMATKGTSTDEIVRVIRAVATNTDAVDTKERGVDALITEKPELPLKPKMKTEFTITDRIATRTTATDAKPLELKPKVTQRGTDPLRVSIRNIDTNTEPEKKKTLVTTGTDAKPDVKVEKTTVATDPLYYLSQRVKETNTSQVVTADTGTEASPRPIGVNRATSPVKTEKKEKHTSYDKVKTTDRGVSPAQRQTHDKGQQFAAVEQKPEVKHALTETNSPPMYGKMVQTSFREPKENKPSLYTKETQTRRLEPELPDPVAVPSISILRPPIDRSVTPTLEPPQSTPPSSDISVHLVFQKSHEEVFRQRDCCSPRAPDCGTRQRVLVCERTTSERIKLPQYENLRGNLDKQNDRTNTQINLYIKKNGKSNEQSWKYQGNSRRSPSSDKLLQKTGVRRTKLGEQCGMNEYKNDSVKHSDRNIGSYEPFKRVKSDSELRLMDKGKIDTAKRSVDWKTIADKMKEKF